MQLKKMQKGGGKHVAEEKGEPEEQKGRKAEMRADSRKVNQQQEGEGQDEGVEEEVRKGRRRPLRTEKETRRRIIACS